MKKLLIPAITLGIAIGGTMFASSASATDPTTAYFDASKNYFESLSVEEQAYLKGMSLTEFKQMKNSMPGANDMSISEVAEVNGMDQKSFESSLKDFYISGPIMTPGL